MLNAYPETEQLRKVLCVDCIIAKFIWLLLDLPSNRDLP